jgi:threonine/homoserine/homoserine lactone efflux protein
LPSGAHIVLSGIQLVLAGIGVGLLVAAPIGPVNVLCIQRAVTKGFWGGLAAGLGAVLGDGLLAAIAAFSMTAISDLMITYSGPIQLFGGALLIVFGIGLLFARPMLLVPPGQKSHLWDHWGIIPQTFFLTISNPGAILGMLALIGGLGSLIGGLDTYFEALRSSPGMGGSLLWWLGCLSDRHDQAPADREPACSSTARRWLLTPRRRALSMSGAGWGRTAHCGSASA